MRRTTPALAVDTNTNMMYDLDLSPRSSICSDAKVPFTPTSPAPLPVPAPARPLQPSIRLLFSLLPRRHRLLLLLPAAISSVIAGGIAPFMTFVVGQAFAAFARYPLSDPSSQDKDRLLRDVGLAAIQLVALAVGALALSSVTSCLWIWTGERNVLALRRRVYEAVTGKEMVWFDAKMGAESDPTEDHGPLGAGGLMAKFTRETDDVRAASSLASGQLLQYLTTTVTCLVLAFTRSWALTLVILSAVPLLILIQAFSQAVASPLLHTERTLSAKAAGLVDRATASIATVKAFNAQAFELSAASSIFGALNKAGRSLNAVWGLTSAMGQFTTLAMFVQGFWFGAKLVRENKVEAGAVMAVFWACLIATSNLQMCIPQLIIIAKGKEACRALLEVVGDAPNAAPAYDEEVPFTAVPKSRNRDLRKIRPAAFAGEFSLHNVTFAYPARQAATTADAEANLARTPEPTLRAVSLFLPASETTFIVGASGSGKSTVAALLLRMYTPQAGEVCVDERDVRFLDEAWLRARVMGVGQGYGGDVVFEGLTVAQNIAVAVGAPEPSQLEIQQACRAALLHEFVQGLPDGYETVLSAGGQGGGQGVCLSGGQRQRLAIARAHLRNPGVLVLDEATSALDATSRLLVFAALRARRQNRTTIVITHDLSQVEAEDFVYVMKDGRVVEQGYRADLEIPASKSDAYFGHEQHDGDAACYTDGRGEFRKMLDVQLGLGGCLPTVDIDTVPAPEYESDSDSEDGEEERYRPQTLLRPLTLGNWMFDVVAELAGPAGGKHETIRPPVPALEDAPRKRRPSSIHIDVDIQMPERVKSAVNGIRRDRRSLQFTPTSPVFPTRSGAGMPHGYGYGRSRVDLDDEREDEEFEGEKNAMTRSGGAVLERRGPKVERVRWEKAEEDQVEVAKKRMWMSRRQGLTAQAITGQPKEESQPQNEIPAFWATVRAVWPTIPHKPLLILGLILSGLSGAMTPLFSFLLSRLLFEVSTGARDTTLINRFGGLVLGVAGIDGLLIGLKYFVMETSGLAWITALRRRAFGAVLKQDKSFFEQPAGSPVRLVQVLVKDADDARNLVSVVAGQAVVVTCMLSVGLIWAMARGWELTLVGLAIAPVFAGVMALQTMLVAGCELRNKRAREEVARGYYDAISNIRGIRAMSFEGVFRSKFDKAAEKALATGVRGAFVEGCTYGVASGLIYLAEALLFYVGAVLIVKGRYNYLQMVEVLNLVVFTVTIGSQLMAFTQRIAKSVQATSDFNHLLKLSSSTPSDSTGTLRPDISGSNAAITFSNVQFAYPSRPDVLVLRNVNLSITPGESVAIVGASGSGKSTIAALLQRLYEPASGSITLAGLPLNDIDATHLRDHVSVVSQHPHLFDASISENIRYGSGTDKVSEVDIRRAAKAANVHEFIMGLPHGYDTFVGENATLVSGGQAQRLQIARALVRPSEVLVLDECTSALDGENQKVVLEAVAKVASEGGRTTVMVTHKLQVMKMCDRVIVVADGEVKEEGTFDELVSRKGLFATLASGGEWVGE
ncbi:hypothetical protein D9615_009430 [Tricholomella constricta]|uniref:P-loop containing nucleoside triphosphate hydrolase protein n=1 Tax=Tricholomella constricta TaxID=117010 RepID=A0A8H5LXB8_9AGAR|nr:hypothetical protein D9615_009430 [Tricholomella constricta]